MSLMCKQSNSCRETDEANVVVHKKVFAQCPHGRNINTPTIAILKVHRNPAVPHRHAVWLPREGNPLSSFRERQ